MPGEARLGRYLERTDNCMTPPWRRSNSPWTGSWPAAWGSSVGRPLGVRRAPSTTHAEASTLIHEDGYLRRLAELHLLAARLHHHQHEPEAARHALIQARDRIEEVGQYAFRARLREIAEELGVGSQELSGG